MSESSVTVPCTGHHWMLPAPGGLTSVGTCKNCGAEKQFSNSSGGGWVLRSAAKRR